MVFPFHNFGRNERKLRWSVIAGNHDNFFFEKRLSFWDYPNRNTLQNGPATGPLEKVSLGPSEKVEPTTKFTILVQNSFLINLKVLISNPRIVFFKFQSKNTKIRYLWSQTQSILCFTWNCFFQYFYSFLKIVYKMKS